MSSKHKKTVKDPESNIPTIAHFVQTLVATQQYEKHKKMVYLQFPSWEGIQNKVTLGYSQRF